MLTSMPDTDALLAVAEPVWLKTQTMSDDVSQRLQEAKARLQRVAIGNESQRETAPRAVAASPMRQSYQAPPTRQSIQIHQPPTMAKARSDRSMQSQHEDYGRMSMPAQYSRPQAATPVNPYGQQQPPSRNPPPAIPRQARPNDVPTTQDLHNRLRHQRAQFENGSPHGQQPPTPQNDRLRQSTSALPSRANERVPQSSASSSSAFSEYSDNTSRTSSSHTHTAGYDRSSAPSVISDLSGEYDDAFDHKLMPPIRKNEYDFMWEGGVLGLVLVEDPQLRLPIVKRVSAHGSTASKYVQEGDVLAYINANNTREYKMPQLMGMLKDLKKPICMRFRRMNGGPDVVEDKLQLLPALGPSEYEFLWEEGSLGMTLGVTVMSTPYVKRLTGRGNSPHLALVNPGDELVMINERMTSDLGFDAAMEFIKSVPKPAVLRFRHAQTPLDTSADIQSTSSLPHPPTTVAPPPAPLPKLEEASMYQVQWSDGPFGLTVKELITDAGPVPVVTRKTGRSTCPGLRRVAVGDYLVEIGSMKVTDLGFENSTKVLRNIAKPVTLKFQAVGD
ncbi:unnamed protein product [Aphanomyces euteiches]